MGLSWTSLSPKQLLNDLIAYIRANDKRAYNYFNDEQLRCHLIESIMRNQIRFLLGPSAEIGGVCTWEFRHAERCVYVVGIVGSTRHFPRHMMRVWKSTYPFYSVKFTRRAQIKTHKPVVNSTRN